MRGNSAKASLLTALLAPATLAISAGAQMPPPKPMPPAGTAPAVAGAPAKPNPAPGQPKPYDQVITSEAKSQDGLFKVHRIDDKVYFEIPASALGREMLWQTEVAELPAGVGYPGVAAGDKLVRWTRRNNKIFLRTVNYGIRTNDQGGLRIGVDAANVQPIVMAFNVEAEGEGKSAVIDVTSLFTTDPGEFSVKQLVRGAGADPNRSYIDRVTAFPGNIETRSLLTFTSGGGGPMIPGFSAGPRGSSATATVHYSLVLLPEKPMQGRFRDPRVGYFADGFTVYGSPRHRVEEEQYIARYRLEKKDPNAELSEPVKPIVYYISREVPEKWRPYIKKGVEDWRPAFAQAGFKDAIVCKQAPTREEDPNWDPEDARYSVIRWAPSPTQNAMGPHVSDPRSGEIISAHVIIWHNVLELLENWYFAQVAALDPKAQKLPFPDDLMGELVRYVTAHEVGHTLGLEHNFKASAAYSVAQLRDPKWTAENGLSGSIMDYARFNYVAQPGDGAKLIGCLGPYDRFAIEWGYKPIPQASTPEAEKPVLDRLAARQVSEPALRFGNYLNPADPTEATEDLGSNPVEATRLGLKNIARAAKLLIPAATRFGEDYSLLAETYEQLLGQRTLELMHVSRLVGGVVTLDFHAGRGGDVYRPVPAAEQRAAAQFLLAEGLTTPPELMDPNLRNRVAASGAISQATSMGRLLLNSLLAETRVQRMFDNEAANGKAAYTVAQLMTDVRAGLWRELQQPAPVVDIYRRDLQRSYLATLDRKLNGGQASATDLRGLAREHLRLLAKDLDRALPRTR
ncbi:MAG TPA: zinc-dependent metalloprotease, partial [Armatimonadota bacterium]|nr:zinc-dependent metalloprotease [Armatimonadota bacterium]